VKEKNDKTKERLLSDWSRDTDYCITSGTRRKRFISLSASTGSRPCRSHDRGRLSRTSFRRSQLPQAAAQLTEAATGYSCDIYDVKRRNNKKIIRKRRTAGHQKMAHPIKTTKLHRASQCTARVEFFVFPRAEPLQARRHK
jgi:hypothetical protein